MGGGNGDLDGGHRGRSWTSTGGGEEDGGRWRPRARRRIAMAENGVVGAWDRRENGGDEGGP